MFSGMRMMDCFPGNVQVREPVTGEAPVLFRTGRGSLRPTEIEATFQPDGELGVVVVFGLSDRGLPVKECWWPDESMTGALSAAPEWVRRFAALQADNARTFAQDQRITGEQVSNYTIDVSYAKVAPSNALLLDRIADEWVSAAYRAGDPGRQLCLAKAAYWRSVKDSAFPGLPSSKNHGL